MMIKVHENPDIYQVEVPLPDNPLRNLNVFVIRDGVHSLIVDTGFNRAECKEALLAGLAELGVDNEHTDLFLTHLHSDHSGLALPVMRGRAGKIMMSAIDAEFLKWTLTGDRWVHTDDAFSREGFTKAQLEWLRYENPARAFEPEAPLDCHTLQDGDTIQVGRHTFRTILTSGHTPGHMCLYHEEKQVLLAGDHILFDISPNITFWVDTPDSLGDYLESLVKIRKVPIQTTLTAHRQNNGNPYVRIDAIIEHHYHRLVETLEAIENNPSSHATKIGSCLKWSMRGKTWDDFPLTQRWFAVGETVSHLDYLLVRGLLTKTVDEYNAYHLAMPLAECMEKLEEIWKQYRKEG